MRSGLQRFSQLLLTQEQLMEQQHQERRFQQPQQRQPSVLATRSRRLILQQWQLLLRSMHLLDGVRPMEQSIQSVPRIPLQSVEQHLPRNGFSNLLWHMYLTAELQLVEIYPLMASAQMLATCVMTVRRSQPTPHQQNLATHLRAGLIKEQEQ
jgi:hypothetical protein